MARMTHSEKVEFLKVNAAIERWALMDDEIKQLRRYLRGSRTAAEYDHLEPEVQAAVNDITR